MKTRVELKVAGEYNGLQYPKTADLISSGWLEPMTLGLPQKHEL
jgi:hypothetical protein